MIETILGWSWVWNPYLIPVPFVGSLIVFHLSRGVHWLIAVPVCTLFFLCVVTIGGTAILSYMSVWLTPAHMWKAFALSGFFVVLGGIAEHISQGLVRALRGA